MQALNITLMRNIFLTLTFGLLLSCQPFDNPKNVMIKEYYNSKQSLKVIVFEKTGNATANSSIQASIEGYDYELDDNDIGNILIADKIELSKLQRDEILKIKWKDNENIEISFPNNLRVFKTEKQFENNIGRVKIEYTKITK